MPTEPRKSAVREAPDALAAAEFVEAGLAEGGVVTLFGRCEVEYDGRASSYLGPGDRLVVLKPDGTLLVHTNRHRTPVNWQPPGCDHVVSVRDDALVVTSTRPSPAERIDITFETVYVCSVLRMEDAEVLELSGTEADLRGQVVDDPDLVEAGFEPTATEYPTPVGSADVVGTDAEGRTTVIELKRRRVGPAAVSQLGRYVDALAREREELIRGILVAPSITEGARDLLDTEGLEFRSLEP